MHFFRSKQVVIAVLALALLCSGALVFLGFSRTPHVPIVPTQTLKKDEAIHKSIGISVQGRSLDAYTYGTGKTRLLFVGGMHGGYEWNSVLLAYEFMDFLEAHPDTLPANLSVTVIPSINPDGMHKVVGTEGRFNLTDVSTDTEVLASGRFNAHEVDLNRNFDCKWKPEGTWKSKTVSAGGSPFSEPETQALKTFMEKETPVAVVFWHSQANAVYASECEKGILPETLAVMNVYAEASGYPAVKSFGAYEVTGDAEGWLASVGIPAITVELSTHEAIEWDRNLSGVQALLQYYREKTQSSR